MRGQPYIFIHLCHALVYFYLKLYGTKVGREELRLCAPLTLSLIIYRVHTQFWADLQKSVDLTKIENAVWTKMSEETEDARTAASTPKTPTAVARATTTRTANDAGSTRHSSKDSSRYESIHDGNPPAVSGGSRRKGQGGRGNSSQRKHPERTPPGSQRTSYRRESRTRGSREENEKSQDEGDQEPAPALDDGSAASFADRFAGFPGYDELGHVPTLEEFRLDWPKLIRSRPEQTTTQSGGAGVGGSKGTRKQQQNQQAQKSAQSNTGSVLHDLSKRDEVFRHFQKYYDRTDHSNGRAGDALFSAGVSSTGLLQPDYDIIEAVGQHTAQAQDERCQSRIGEGVLSTPDTDSGARRSGSQNDVQRSGYSGTMVTRGGTRTGSRADGYGDGLINVFRDPINATEGAAVRSAQGPAEGTAFRGGNDAAKKVSNGGVAECGDRRPISGSLGGRNGGSGRSGARAPGSAALNGSGDGRRAKASVEGSSTSAELQVSESGQTYVIYFAAQIEYTTRVAGGGAAGYASLCSRVFIQAPLCRDGTQLFC